MAEGQAVYIDTRILIVFFVMLVVLAVLLFQAKARIIMAQARGPVSPRQKLVRYLIAFLVWAVITAGVLLYAIKQA